jgi:hypothetical protein
MIQYFIWDFQSPQGEPELKGQLFTILPAQAKERIKDIVQQDAANIDVEIDVKINLYLLFIIVFFLRRI